MGFVQEQYPWTMQHPAGDIQRAAHAAGEPGHWLVTALPQVEQLQALAHAVPDALVPHAVETPAEQQVLPGTQALVEGGFLEHQADARAYRHRLGEGVVPGYAHLALVRAYQGAEDMDTGGLAGAVRPEQAIELPLAQFQVQLRHGGARAVMLADVLGEDDRLRHGGGRFCWTSGDAGDMVAEETVKMVSDGEKGR